MNARVEPDVREQLTRILEELQALRAEVAALHRARAALDAGRARAIAEKRKSAAYRRQLVLELAAVDQQAGRPTLGRAGRVARKLEGIVSESHVRKILSRTQSSARDSAVSNSEN